MKTKDILDPSYFNKLIKDDMLFIRTIQTDTLNYYTLGVFSSRPDAEKYLEFVKDNLLKDAYIVNQNDLDNQSVSIAKPIPVVKNTYTRKVFTIQLRATKNPIDIEKMFRNYKGVREVVGGDGFYRYVYGEYPSIWKAKDALVTVKKDFGDAFIKEVAIP
jgi:hypothetical protein